jgi:hypothetical protein
MPTDGGEADVLAAAAVLQARGVSNVLVKLGKHGSMLVPAAPALPLRQPALRAEKARPAARTAAMMPHAADVSRALFRWWTPPALATASQQPSASR